MMQANHCCRWLLVSFLLVSSCFLITYARRGGGGSRGSSSRGSSSRGTSYGGSRVHISVPAPAPRPRPISAPRPAPASRPAPAPAPAPKPAPAPALSYSQSVPKPNGPPPPYSAVGHPAPSAPVGPPPSYQSSGSLANLPPAPPYPKPPASYPRQPPPYPGQPGRPPSYPGLAASAPAQPGSPLYPRQPGHPGSYPAQPELNRPYIVQPGSPGFQQPNVHKPYPVQPGSPGFQQSNVHKPYPVQPGSPGFQQSNIHKPYPVQPGFNPYPGVNRPYPQQSLGGNVWQPHQYGVPPPAYMNYGGIPTGTNMHANSHKKKGFLGSLMSVGKNKPEKKKNKYYGSYPSPYGIKDNDVKYGTSGFLGKHGSSASMYTIFPYMVAKKAHKIRKPKFGFMPMYMPRHHYHRHHHHYHHDLEDEIDFDNTEYFDVYNDNYVGKCQQPIKKKNSKIVCNGTFDELQCIAKCDEGYRFNNSVKNVTNKCWHVTGVWKPKKNFPDCLPVCDDECLNGGQCIAPEVCKCTAEYRGSRCQFYFLKCNILTLLKEKNVAWVCKHHKDETVCHVRCKNSSEFDLSAVVEYKCTPNGVWTPDKPPECDVNKS